MNSKAKSEAAILVALHAGKPITQIAKDLGISRQAIYKRLATLERHGKIQRVGLGKYQVIDKKPHGNAETKAALESKQKSGRTEAPKLPRHIQWRIKECERLLGRKRTRPGEDVIRTLTHLGVLRVQRDRYEVRTKDFPILLYNLVSGFTNEALKLAGEKFRLPRALDKEQIVLSYYVDFRGGVWEPRDLRRLSRWENPSTKRLLRDYIRFLKERYKA